VKAEAEGLALNGRDQKGIFRQTCVHEKQTKEKSKVSVIKRKLCQNI